MSIGTADVASWTDNSRSTCTAQLTMDGATINNLTTIDKEGTLKLTVTDPAGNASSADIKLTASGILGLESLKLLNLQVDQEVNLLERITLGNGTSLTKVQIEID